MALPEAESARGGAFSVLANRRFAKIWSAGVISQTGDFLLIVGLPYYVYRLTGSVLLTGTLFLVAVAPSIVLGTVAGVFVDRWDRRRTMIATNLLLGLGLLPLLWVTSAGAVWIVYLVAGFEACIDPFFGPAEGALVPRLVGKSDLLQANALIGGGRQVARLVGSAAGGVVVALWGLSGVALGDSLTFFVAAGLVMAVGSSVGSSERTIPAPGGGWTALTKRFGREWIEGLRASARTHPARELLTFVLVIGVGEGVFTTLVAPFMIRVLHGTGVEYGLFLGLQAIGGIVGAVYAATAAHRLAPARILPPLAAVFGALDAAIFTYPLFWSSIVPAFVLIVLVGLPGALAMAALSTLQQTAVPDELRGRFLGALGTAGAVALVAGIVAATVLTDRIGIVPVLEIQAVGYLGGGFYLSRTLPRKDSAAEARPGSTLADPRDP